LKKNTIADNLGQWNYLFATTMKGIINGKEAAKPNGFALFSWSFVFSHFPYGAIVVAFCIHSYSIVSPGKHLFSCLHLSQQEVF
jgi:hypothetical protein